MPRCRADSLQPEVVRLLRSHGWTVQVLSQVGGGCPDLLVASPQGETFLIEVKTENRPLSPRQQAWIQGWNGRVEVIRSLQQARDLVIQIQP